MTVAGWLEIALFLAVLTALTPLLGGYMARVFTRRASHTLGFVERPLYRLLGVRPRARPGLEGLRALRARLQRAVLRCCSTSILRTQGAAPVQPAGPRARRTWDVSFNTAASFVTNTNWQYYARRDDALVLLADGRPGGAELRLRRRRDRGRWSPSSAASPSRSGERARQLLRRPHPRAALRPAAARR